MKSLSVRTLAFVVALGLGFAVPGTAVAQYKLSKLTENLANVAPHTDPNLVNAWGLARSSSGPFWVSDNGTGLSTLYDGTGTPQSLAVSIPSVAGGPGSPSGIAFNGSNDFVVSQNGLSGTAFFLFATIDGAIVGWSPSVALNNAVIAADNSKAGAVYTGLAISSGKNGNFLYAADTANNRVDVYDGSFRLIKTLTDPTIPEGFSAYGIRDINGQVYVSYASTGNAPGGFIDIFTEQGAFVKRFAEGGTLNQPWGMALAPVNFGPFSTALLISNNTPEGTINAFNAKTGKFLGQLKDSSGKVIHIDQVWGLEFGGGSSSNGAVNQLFFTGGPSNYGNGEFGVIQFTGK